MSGPPNLPLAAAASASVALADLLEIARDGTLTPCVSLDGDTIPALADALKMTIEHSLYSQASDGADAEGRALAEQLLAALSAFLEGWV